MTCLSTFNRRITICVKRSQNQSRKEVSEALSLSPFYLAMLATISALLVSEDCSAQCRRRDQTGGDS